MSLVAGGVALVGLGYASAFLPGPPPDWGAGLVVGGTATSLVAVMALGALGRGGLRVLLPTFAFVLVVVGGGLGVLLLLPPADPADPTLVLGLPLRAAILLYGVGLVPVLVVPFAYAATFERLTLDDEELARIRRVAEQRRMNDGPAGEPAVRAELPDGERPAGGEP